MGLDIYWTGLLVLAPAVAFSAGGHTAVVEPLKRLRWKTWTTLGAGSDASQEKPLPSLSSSDCDCRAETGCSVEARRSQFRRTFFQVYLLVMGSEWLQVSETGIQKLRVVPVSDLTREPMTNGKLARKQNKGAIHVHAATG